MPGKAAPPEKDPDDIPPGSGPIMRAYWERTGESWNEIIDREYEALIERKRSAYPVPDSDPTEAAE